MKKYIVELTLEQREELSHMTSTGKAPARQLTHARILLKADQGPYGPAWSDAQIQHSLEISPGTVATRAETVRLCDAQRGDTAEKAGHFPFLRVN